MTYHFQMISVDKLVRGRYQPRRHFDESLLEELGQSILTQGLIEPLVVRAEQNGFYEIVAGERRWRAAMRKGIQVLACVIGDYNDAQAATVAIVENIQRQDLNLIEEAQGYQRLIQSFHFTQEDVAALVGKSRSHIANLTRLLTLVESVQNLIERGQLSLGHARLLVSLPKAQQRMLAQEAVSQQWTVKKLEKEIKTFAVSVLPSAQQDLDVQRLAQALSAQMGAPIEFEATHGSAGWLKIKYFDTDTLSGLLERMGLRYD
jgi:ParB family chromosome partitioning protein